MGIIALLALALLAGVVVTNAPADRPAPSQEQRPPR
jgi:hypothetical protein